MPAKSLKKQREAASRYYERHKTERAAYMRKYRRRRKRTAKSRQRPARPA